MEQTAGHAPPHSGVAWPGRHKVAYVNRLALKGRREDGDRIAVARLPNGFTASNDCQPRLTMGAGRVHRKPLCRRATGNADAKSPLAAVHAPRRSFGPRLIHEVREHLRLLNGVRKQVLVVDRDLGTTM